MAISWTMVVWLATSLGTHKFLVSSEPRVDGTRVEPIAETKDGKFHTIRYTDRDVSILNPDILVRVVIFGSSLDELGEISFHLAPLGKAKCPGTPATVKRGRTDIVIQDTNSVEIKAKFPSTSDGKVFHLCTRAFDRQTSSLDRSKIVAKPWTWITTEEPTREYYLTHSWIQIAVVAVLLVISGIFSGLNLGLMALTPQELMLMQKSGSPTERRNAGIILPIRERGNLLLCTLLIGNVIVNAAISILFDNLTSGFIALLVSSAGIVVVGEIFPQSLCVKKGLTVGANTVWLTQFFMVLTFLIAYPISKILDLIFREEVRSYDRKRLIEIMKTNDSKKQEDFKMALGAMLLKDKTAKDVMTKIDDVYMLADTTVLSTEIVTDIARMGYTRIPVYEGDRNNIVSLLFVIDLPLIDPDDNYTVKTVCEHHHHPLRFVSEQTPLLTLLSGFRKGDYHLAVVERQVQRSKDDPIHELIGVVTLEDIVEEIIQAEIVDETDCVIDNVHKTRRRGAAQARAVAALTDEVDGTTRILDPKLQVATLQWLATNLRAFHPDIVDSSILERFIRNNCKKIGSPETNVRSAKLYTENEYSEKFILILEGRATVTVGMDGMSFEAAPWQPFGIKMLDLLIAATQVPDHPKNQKIGFTPDYSAVVRGDCTFFELSSSEWMLAYRSSKLTATTPPARHK